MKNIFLFSAVLLAGFYFYGCSDSMPTKPSPKDSTTTNFGCPPPSSNMDGFIFPDYMHTYLCISPDGSKLAYLREGGGQTYLHILDHCTGEDRAYPELYSTIPAPWKLVSGRVADWCPYDNNRVLLNCAVSTRDPITNRSRVGNVLFVFALDGSEFQRLPFSACDSVFQLSPYCKWLPSSKPGNDIFTLGATSTSSGTKPKCILSGFYYWQENRFLLYDSTTKNTIWVYDISKNGTYTLSPSGTVSGEKVYYINGKSIFFERISELIDFPGSTTFSPDEKRLALFVLPRDTDLPIEKWRYNEIWIFRVVDLLKSDALHPAKPEKIINTRRNFCMYSGATPYTEFTTDTTLAVSMYKDKGEAAFIYEISTDGKMLRQLTTKP